ncbi:MAG: hypothetical protein ACLGH0_02830 [Thermoanaerobaculia bacterium]
MDATAKLIAVIVLASFATERILSTARWLLESEIALRARRKNVKERRRVLLLMLAGAIALLVIDKGALRIMTLLDAGHGHPWMDYWLTWLVFFAGAERARSLLAEFQAAAPAKEEKPVPIVKLTTAA